MNVNGKHYRTIWVKPGNDKVIQVIDQRELPHKFVIEDLKSSDDVARAIKEMHVRGAGLIGAAAGFGMYLAALEAQEKSFNDYILKAAEKLKATRPTAVNLAAAVERQLAEMKKAGTGSVEDKKEMAFQTANAIADEDAESCRMIGQHGLKLIERIAATKKGPVNIMTHCNAGWLAFVDYGSATAPIYAAAEKGIGVHVWVSETRPRNQGASLTAWELVQQGIPHHVIVDNAAGHLMQHGMVDMVIVGSDRTTYTGDVANKIGTYLKALAAKNNRIPFYVALPSTTFDWKMRDGIREIPIEERSGDEVKFITGRGTNGKPETVLLTPSESPATNYGFDVTSRRLVTGIITERGICQASENGILKLFPERGAKTDERGVIKFDCKWKETKPFPEPEIAELNHWRNKLYDLGLIGVYPNGIGYGNISLRIGKSNNFLVSGSATGKVPKTDGSHYAKVTGWDFASNVLACEGPVKASSESLTHAAIYEVAADVNGIIHVHNKALWGRLMDKLPTTSKKVEYGTPEMAAEVMRLMASGKTREVRFIVMGGHEEGVLTFGRTIDDAGQILLHYFGQL